MIKIEKVDQDEETGSEVLYWATHFPVSYQGYTTGPFKKK